MTKELLSLLAVFLLFEVSSHAAPVISGISSPSLSHGQIYSVSGSQFGSKTPVEPAIWDTFDSDTPGQLVPNLAHGTYWDVQEGTYRNPVFSNAMQRTAGDVSVLQDYSTAGNKTLSITHPMVNNLYLAMWLYRHDYEGRANEANNAKISGNWTGLVESYFPQCRYELNPSGWPVDRPSAHLFNNPYNPDDPSHPGSPGIDFYADGRAEARRWNQWFLLERYTRLGDPGQPNGLSFVRSNGREMARIQGVFNHGNESTYDQWNFGHYFVCQSVNEGDAPCPVGVNLVPMRQYISSVYADTTLKRVMICDQSSWSLDSYRHCEVQIPRQAWNDTSLFFEANRGSFAGNTQLHLYVINENDEASNAFPVVFTGQGDLTVPAAPGNLRSSE